MDEVSLYFHIPFCTRKCDYCHFYVLPNRDNLKDVLLEAFFWELDLYHSLLLNKKIISIYFGGGTPSLFEPNRISQIIKYLKKQFCVDPIAEITLEVNPENVNLELMNSYREVGINRVSIGIQTLDAELLSLLGRLHSPQIATEAIHFTYDAGIKNISIDLMYDLPKQHLIHWETTLQKIDDLPITHLSLYNLTIEPHTLFFKNKASISPLLPDDQTSLAMYELAIEYMEKKGLKQYEISAFANEGYYSRHNTGYWTGRPFLGIGPSAFSYWDGRRFRNIAHLQRYHSLLKDNVFPVDYEETLDHEAHIRELFVIHLRLKEGVSMRRFQSEVGVLDLNTAKNINDLVSSGFLTWENENLLLTKKGVLFYDTVASELI